MLAGGHMHVLSMAVNQSQVQHRTQDVRHTTDRKEKQHLPEHARYPTSESCGHPQVDEAGIKHMLDKSFLASSASSVRDTCHGYGRQEASRRQQNQAVQVVRPFGLATPDEIDQQ